MIPRIWDDLTDAVGRDLDLTSRADVWVGLHLLTGAVPAVEVVTETRRRAEFDGASALLAARTVVRPGTAVEVLAAPILVDVGEDDNLPAARLVTRLMAQTLPRWRRHDVVEVCWREDGAGIVRADDRSGALLVPLGGRYVGLGQDLTPEVQGPLLSMVHSSGLATTFVGYDCVPITDAESVPEGCASAFANRLAALRHADRVVAVGEAAAVEFRGWRRMLGGAGLPGPEIVVLAPGELDPGAGPGLGAARPGRTVVVAGDDRLGVLAALDRLRAEGLDPSVVELAADDADERRLTALGSARFTVAPARHGYALDAADSLAVGVPVLTSDHGSAAEVAAAGGALLVDPRDDDALTDALRRLLVDDDLVAGLAEKARARSRRSWDEYAALAWDASAEG